MLLLFSGYFFVVLHLINYICNFKQTFVFRYLPLEETDVTSI